MRIRLLLLVFVVLPALLSASATPLVTSGPPYWIDGLVLPTGAAVVHQEKLDPIPAKRAKDYDLVPDRQEVGVLTVGFDTPDDWSAVVDAIASALEPQGYTNTRRERRILQVMQDKGLERAAAEVEADREMGMADSLAGPSAEFTAPDSNYWVFLKDQANDIKMAQSFAQSTGEPAPKLGRFALIVVKLADADAPTADDAGQAPEGKAPQGKAPKGKAPKDSQ